MGGEKGSVRGRSRRSSIAEESRVSRNSTVSSAITIRYMSRGSHFSVFTATFRGNVARSAYTRRQTRRCPSDTLSLLSRLAKEKAPPPPCLISNPMILSAARRSHFARLDNAKRYRCELLGTLLPGCLRILN